MKILVINRVNFSEPVNQGIYQKLVGQITALQNLGHDATAAYVYGNEIRVQGAEQVAASPKVASKYHLYHNVFYPYLQNIIDTIKPDVVILRFHLFHLNILKFIKHCRKQGVYSIMEFPTFPFHTEFTSIGHRLRLALHQRYLKDVTKCTDRFFHYGDDDRIYGKSSVRLTNGIDVDQFELCTSVKEEARVTLIAVGKWQKGHGIDRLLLPLAARKEVDIRLLVVGSTHYLKTLQSKQVLNSPNIEFLGSLTGEQLTRAFERAQIGVGVLGLHRNQLISASPLKHREYCARGCSFIYSAKDPDFDHCDFIKRFPSNDESIDLRELKKFCQQSEKLDRRDIRAYAKDHLHWEDRMSKVLERS